MVPSLLEDHAHQQAGAQDGTHVLRFEEPLPLIDCEDTDEAIRLNTRAYNAALERMLLRHPEQWIWMHKRWKMRG